MLSAFGHKAAALEIGQLRLAQNPDDPIQSYLVNAVRGTAVDRASIAYIERYFDRFAAKFDEKLVTVLRYDPPAVLGNLVAGHRTIFSAILDLGCGTGLAAEHLASFSGALTGVDLSAGMLAEAEKRGGYDKLIKAEALSYLSAHPVRFDLVFSADVLIYFGDLKPVVNAASSVLLPSGVFAFTLESTTVADYSILPSERFAHSSAYVERLLAQDFAILDIAPAMIRLEANKPVDGLFIVAQRR